MATAKELITQLYVGYFDRAPEPEGLQYWIGRYNDGFTLAEIAQSFSVQPESTALYPYLANPDVASPATFITNVYLNLFNRAPDAEGLAYWVEQIGSGKPVGEAILDIISGATTEPDASVIANKVEAGIYWAEAATSKPGFQYDAAAATAARGALDGVTEDPATVDASKAATDAIFNFETFKLTTGTDVYTGVSSGSTLFEAKLAPAIDGLLGAQTLQGSDVLNGGPSTVGQNVLRAELNGTGATQSPTISNVQLYELTAFPGLFGGGASLDLSRATGYEQIVNKGSVASLTLNNVSEVADLGLDGVRGGNAFNVNYDGDTDVEEQNVTVINTGSAASGYAWLNINGADIGTLNLDVTNSRIDVDANVVDEVNLAVSGGVFIELGADGAENFNLSGTGPLDIEGESDFAGLVNFNSADYDGDLSIDISGSTVLETVVTGEGDDRVVVRADAVDGNLSIDLGDGANTLAIADGAPWWSFSASEINGLDFKGGVSNVQTLEFVNDINLFADATLDFEGFDVAPALVKGLELDGNGRTFGLADAAETLTLEFAGDVEDVNLDAGNVVDLTIVASGVLDLDSVTGESLESLTLSQVEEFGDLWLDLDGSDDLGALQSVSASSAGDAVVEFDATGADADFESLTDINVSAAGNATLVLDGRSGTREVLGVRQVEQFTVNVNAALFTARTGEIVFTSNSLPAGVAVATYNVSGLVELALDDEYAAQDIAAGLNAVAGLSASVPTGLFGVPTSNVVTVTRDDFGPQQQLTFFDVNETSGTISSPTQGTTTALVTDGVLPVDMVAGEGFEALETVVVTAETGDADVELTDVYGLFSLEVTAGDDAWVDLINTDVTSVSVTAGDRADIDIGGDTVAARSLETVIVAADSAVVTLGTAGLDAGVGNDFSSFLTLDAAGVVTTLTVGTSDASFEVGTGQYVTYSIGATETVTITNNDIREVFEFVGSDIGDVTITDFTAGADPVSGDRLDLSQFGINSAGQLIFTVDGADLVITDLGADDFGGSITLVGLGAQADDVANFNIIYA